MNPEEKIEGITKFRKRNLGSKLHEVYPPSVPKGLLDDRSAIIIIIIYCRKITTKCERKYDKIIRTNITGEVKSAGNLEPNP